MPKDDRFKAKLTALEAARADPGAPASLAVLRKGLADPSNFVVAKAATMAGECLLAGLAPDLIRVFDALLVEPDDDPGCRAKFAVAEALKAFEHRDPAPFLRGLAHVQREPVSGRLIDTAGPLRGACAQALVACDIAPDVLVERLTDHLVDPDKAARIEAICALAQLGRPECVSLLRLKALAGDAEAEVVGQCLLSLLGLAPTSAVAFIARFFDSKDDEIRFEAVNALAAARSADAIDAVRAFWSGDVTPDLRVATVAALAGSPLPEAAAFLLEVLSYPQIRIAEAALAALGASRFGRELRESVRAAVAASGSQTLLRAFALAYHG